MQIMLHSNRLLIDNNGKEKWSRKFGVGYSLFITVSFWRLLLLALYLLSSRDVVTKHAKDK